MRTRSAIGVIGLDDDDDDALAVLVLLWELGAASQGSRTRPRMVAGEGGVAHIIVTSRVQAHGVCGVGIDEFGRSRRLEANCLRL